MLLTAFRCRVRLGSTVRTVEYLGLEGQFKWLEFVQMGHELCCSLYAVRAVMTGNVLVALYIK